MTTDQILSLSGNIIAIILGIVAIYLGSKHARKLALETGALDKPHPGIMIGNSLLIEKGQCNIIFCSDFSKIDHLFCFLPLSIINQGRKSAEDIVVIIEPEGPLGNNVLAIDDETPMPIEQYHFPFEIKQTYSYLNGVKKFMNHIPQLGVGMVLHFQIPLMIDATVIDIKDIPVKTSDNFDFQISGQFQFSYKFHIYLLAKDYPARKYRLNIKALDVKDREQLQKIAMSYKISLARTGIDHLIFPNIQEVQEEEDFTIAMANPSSIENITTIKWGLRGFLT